MPVSDPQQTPAPEARRASTWRRYLRFWGPHAASDVDDELRFHLEMRERDYLVRGLSPIDAHTAALRRLGNLDSARTACIGIITRRERRMARAEMLDVLRQDAKFALRTLGRHKAWTAVAVFTLALGIGANTAMFSVVEGVLWHSLRYPNADRLVFVVRMPKQDLGNDRVFVSPSTSVARAWRESARSFLDITAYSTRDVLLRARNATVAESSQAGTEAGATLVHAGIIMSDFLQFAGGRPLVGRGFTATEAHEHAHVAMISEAMWRGRFAGSRRVVGRSIAIDDSLYTVIGVMPESVRLPRTFGAPDGTDVWLPRDLSDDSTFSPTVVGRLRRGVTLKAAATQLDSIAARAERASETAPAGRAARATKAAPLQYSTQLLRPEQLVTIHDSLMLLTGAVSLVLLIACVNVAHLLLARAATRDREMAVRAALGASRRRLLRQLVTESLVLAGAGCAAGIGVAWLALDALTALRPASMVALADVRLDATAFMIAVAISVATGIVFGVVGVLHGGRYSAHDALKGGARSVSQTAGQRRTRSALVVSEMALSATLVVGAALLVRSLVNLQSTDPGFRPDGLYSVSIPMVQTTQDAMERRTHVLEDLEQRVRLMPGVQDAVIADAAPPNQSFYEGALQFEGHAPPPPGSTSFFSYNGTEPNYFRLMGLRIVKGTTFTDTSKAAGQVVVNEAMARKGWPGQSAIGRRLRIVNDDGSGNWRTVVGVVANARLAGMTSDPTEPMVFVASTEHFNPTLLVRTTGLTQPIIALRRAAVELNRGMAQPDVRSVSDAMSASLAEPRFTMLLLAMFSVLALVLAAVGLYGVMAYSVEQRTREIGIRMALGASRQDVARTVLRHGVSLALVGGAIGLVGAFWATRLLTRMLYGVAHTDAVSFGAGALVLLGTAVLACLVPARRAVSIDPAIAMRTE